MKDSSLYEAAFGYRRRRQLSLDCLFFAILFLFIFGFRLAFTVLYHGVVVSGSSMNPTLLDGDFLYVNAYASPDYGDIVVIDVENYEGEYHFSGSFIIKRVIGMEGDRIYCIDGAVYISYAGTETFVLLDEPYINNPTNSFPVVTVGKNELFVLGDNRSVSLDSRRVGCFSEANFYGVVTPWSLSMRSFLRAYYNFIS